MESNPRAVNQLNAVAARALSDRVGIRGRVPFRHMGRSYKRFEHDADETAHSRSEELIAGKRNPSGIVPERSGGGSFKAAVGARYLILRCVPCPPF